MKFFVRTRLRVVIALLVLIPSLVASTVAVLLAKEADSKALAAEAASDDLAVLRAARDAEASTVSELAFYLGWLRSARTDAFDADEPLLMALRRSYAEAAVALSDRALADFAGLRTGIGKNERIQAQMATEAMAAARHAFEAEDLEGVAAAEVIVDTSNLTISAAGDHAITRQGGSWLVIDRQSAVIQAVASELAFTGPLVITGAATPQQLIDATLLADRTDQAFQQLLAVSSPADRQLLVAARAEVDDIEALRAALTATTSEDVEPVSFLRLATAVGKVEDFSSLISASRDATTATVASDAERDAIAARRDADSLRLLIVVIVVIPTVLVARVSARFSVRLGRLQRAAETVTGGQFDLEPVPAMGRDELAVLTESFNEMIGTLSTTHRQVMALSEGDMGDPVLNEDLPGTIGRTMRAALNRLGSTQQELAHKASHDDLTGLLDRAGLMSRMTSFSESESEFATVALLDLDRFKAVNDTYGHAAGDQVLVTVARRLQRITRPTDVVARLGGDELLIVFSHVEAPAGVESLMHRIISSIEEPVPFSGQQVSVGASMGWTKLSPSESFEAAMARADAAMYQAKAEGRGGLIHA